MNATSRLHRIGGLLTFALAALLFAVPEADAQRGQARGNAGGARASAHTSVHRPTNQTRPAASVNRNVNRNVNRDINVNRNINVDVDYHDDHHHWNDWDDHPFATAAAVTAGVAITSAVIGSIVYSVPPSCVTTVINGIAYQQCGNTWYQPRYYGTSVQYVVVVAP